MGGKWYSLWLVLFILAAVPVHADFEQELDDIKAQIEEEFSDVFSSENPQDKLLIVLGDQMSGVEKAAAFYIRTQIPSQHVIDQMMVAEGQLTPEQIQNENRAIFMLGGPSQNRITNELLSSQVVEEPEIEDGKLFAVARGQNAAEQKVVVFSDNRGFLNLAREGAYLSPLSNFMPVEYVPAAASIIAVLLAWLAGFVKRFIAGHIVAFGQKRAEVKEEFMGVTIGGFQLKVREIISIILGALFFGLGIALSMTGLQAKLIETFKITLVLCLFIFVLRESSRFILMLIMKIKAEYMVWWTGVGVAVFSGFLGNSLNTPGFVVEVKDENAARKTAFMKYLVSVFTFAGGSIFFFLNFFNPSPVFQLIFVTATTLSLAEIMPIKPLPGAAIIRWRPIVWTFTVITMIVTYGLMNFVI